MIVLGILLMISIPVDYAFSSFLSHSIKRKYVRWREVIYDSIDADLLILGSSRAGVQYDPYIIDTALHINSYNLGIDASCLNRQLLKFRIYKYYQNRNAKMIIVNIDYYSSLGYTVKNEREQFFPYLLKQFAREEMKRIEPFSFGELYLPMYRYYKHGVYSIFLDSHRDSTLYKGYRGEVANWDGSAFSEINTLHFITDDERTEKDFDVFLGQMKDQNVKIVFVYAPIYIGLTNKVDNLVDFYETFQSYSDKYQIPILDYTYHYLSYDTSYFYNALHLNKTGAELFTTKLCHDLDSLGLLK